MLLPCDDKSLTADLFGDAAREGALTVSSLDGLDACDAVAWKPEKHAWNVLHLGAEIHLLWAESLLLWAEWLWEWAVLIWLWAE